MGWEVVGATIKGNTKEFLCGDWTVLYLDCGSGYTNLHMGLNCKELQTYTHKGTTNKQTKISACKNLLVWL